MLKFHFHQGELGRLMGLVKTSLVQIKNGIKSNWISQALILLL